MTTVTENITPNKAMEYLATSVGNRPLSSIYVRSYADTMKKGKWLLNGVPIIFDADGHLLDGHHRLEAVKVAGIPVRFDVVRGAPTEGFTTYDNGRHRTTGQLLAMQSVKHYNLVASIVSANERLKESGRLYHNNGNNAASEANNRIKRTNDDHYNLYREDPEGFNAVAERIVSLQGRVRVILPSWAGAIYYYLTHTGGYSINEVDPFFDALYSLETDTIPAVTMLRRALTKDAFSGRKMMPETLWAFIAKTWNAYITGKTPKILRYTESESIPTLILKTNSII